MNDGIRRAGLALAALTLAVSCTPPGEPAEPPAPAPPPGKSTAPTAAASPSAVAEAPTPSAAPPPAAPPPAPPAPTGPAPTGPAPTGPAPTGACPKDMVDGGLACVDRYEAPNEQGSKPLLMQSARDGEAWCAERGKRLCRDVEWKRACMGKRGYNFPYGAKFKMGVCNDDKTWKPPRWKVLQSHPGEAADKEVARLDQSEPSGAREGCVSPEGAFDMTGNVAEWVIRTEETDTNYSHVVMGCYWGRCYRPPHRPSCDYVNWMHRAEERSYEMGFRCCKDKA